MTKEILQFTPKRELLKIDKDKIVTLEYALFDGDSDDLIEYRNDFAYLHGSKQNELSKLQQAIEGHKIGMKTEVRLTAAEAFGLQDPNLVITEPLKNFPPELARVGATIEGESSDGKVVPFRIASIDSDLVVLDGNHPLAGRNLKFVVEVIDIRDATSQELAAGHAIKLESNANETQTH